MLLTKLLSAEKSLAVLLDPDKVDLGNLGKLVNYYESCSVDFLFIGGSLLSKDTTSLVINSIKSQCSIPTILFPGSPMQVVAGADALLFLSLVSGRNPDYLIGQQVISAPLIKALKLEVIPTAYCLVDCGKQTTASYISNTTPIPYDKPEIAAATAMASEMLGLKVIYLDGGSGAKQPISAEMISAVRASVSMPLIVGGGIRSSEDAKAAWNAGATLLVVGNALEKNPSFAEELGLIKQAFGSTNRPQ